MTISIKFILKFNNCPNNIKQNSIDIFSKLLESQESKIRNMGCQRFEEKSKILYQEENFDKILINLKKLDKDTTLNIRTSLSNNIIKISLL